MHLLLQLSRHDYLLYGLPVSRVDCEASLWKGLTPSRSGVPSGE